MEHAWIFIWNRLFDERTCMFYNYLVGDEPDAAVKYLPEPELIRLGIPNPGGYGTGMEDCMLNAGLMMDAVVARYEATGDAGMRAYAEKIWRGMELAASVSPGKGFLPRGVSPADCRSHYIDTSRDQYTNWWYGACRLYYSDLSNKEQRESVRRLLTGMAEKMQAEVIPENGWSFLREDGERGFAGQMWGNVDPHEALRLPMLYLLTWKTTGNPHWRDLYFRYRDDALRKTSGYVPLSGPTYAALQLQYSLRLVCDLDDDPAVRESCLSLMRKNAEPNEAMAVRKAEQLMTPEGAGWLRIPYVSWKQAKARYSGCRGGKAYFVPEPSDFREDLAYYPLRAVGEGIAVAATCPGWKVSEQSRKILCQMTNFVDYRQHDTCAPIALVEAYWLSSQ